MKYFEYITILILFAVAIFSVYSFWRRLKIHHFYRLSFKAILKKQISNCHDNYFSSYYLFLAVKELLSAYGKEAKQALIYLCVGKSAKAEAYFIRRNKPLLALALKAMSCPAESLAEMEHSLQDNPQNQALLVELAVLYFLAGDKSKCRLALNNLTAPRQTYVRARQAYLETYFDLYDGDMLSASANCSYAINYFRKCHAYYETGRAYLLMGIIYRTAIISDVSEMMFRAAREIFENLQAKAEAAKTLANFGMLMAMQSRFEEAETYYIEAEAISLQFNRTQSAAEINNQQGLMCLMKNDLDNAAALSALALDKHQKLENYEGVAFSKEILGNIAWQKKEFQQALQYAYEAKNLYKEQKNMSAYLENMYLMALSLFEQNKDEEAEKILREIIENSKEHRTSFHTANAYNLLGLIYLKTGDLQRARGLFQQSLDLEQVSNRLSGIATDYANISQIEIRRGEIEQGNKTLQTAIDYAKANDDEELVAILTKQLKMLSSK